MLLRARAFPQMPVSQSSGLGLDQRSTALETNSRMSPLTNSRIQYTIRLNTAARKGTLRQAPCRTPPARSTDELAVPRDVAFSTRSAPPRREDGHGVQTDRCRARGALACGTPGAVPGTEGCSRLPRRSQMEIHWPVPRGQHLVGDGN